MLDNPFDACIPLRDPSDNRWLVLPEPILAALRRAEEPEPGAGWYNPDRSLHSRHFYVGVNKYAVSRLLACWRYGTDALKTKPICRWIDGDPLNEHPSNIMIEARVMAKQRKPRADKPVAPNNPVGRPRSLPISAPSGTPEYAKQYARLRRLKLLEQGLITERKPSVSAAIVELSQLPAHELQQLLATVRGVAPSPSLPTDEPVEPTHEDHLDITDIINGLRNGEE